jgi:DNA repair protein RecO
MSLTTTEPIEGIVLSSQEYNERDLIVHLLNSKEIYSIYCKGVRSMKSKNRRLTAPFSSVELQVTTSKNSQLKSLVSGRLLAAPLDLGSDLELSALCFALRDCIERSTFYPYYYPILQKFTAAALAKNHREMYLWAASLLAWILQAEGIAPFVHGCVKCGSKKGIEAFSIQAGGFLCKDCNQSLYPKKSREELKSWRILFAAKPEQFEGVLDQVKLDEEDVLYLLAWYETYTHTELASLSFYRQVLGMKEKTAKK